jgi:hypothetical protein
MKYLKWFVPYLLRASHQRVEADQTKHRTFVFPQASPKSGLTLMPVFSAEELLEDQLELVLQWEHLEKKKDCRSY